jgi:VIT1/CCC1 family predicted Fe2+/Mn2+ transporter
MSARPLQAALASACSFAAGSALPLLVVALGPKANLIPVVSGASLLFLGFLGGLAAYVGNANVARGVIRVTFWSALAMGVTAGVGALLGRVLAP